MSDDILHVAWFYILINSKENSLKRQNVRHTPSPRKKKPVHNKLLTQKVSLPHLTAFERLCDLSPANLAPTD